MTLTKKLFDENKLQGRLIHILTGTLYFYRWDVGKCNSLWCRLKFQSASNKEQKLKARTINWAVSNPYFANKPGLRWDLLFLRRWLCACRRGSTRSRTARAFRPRTDNARGAFKIYIKASKNMCWCFHLKFFLSFWNILLRSFSN